MRLRFIDGVEFDTSGEYRVERRSDGLYVVGKGMLCPVNSQEEAQKLLDKLTKKPTKLRG